MSFKNFADALYKVCIVLGISAGIAIIAKTMTHSRKGFDEEGYIAKSSLTVENGQMTPEVLLAFGRLSDPQVSPDGKHILYGVSYTSTTDNKSVRNLAICALDGSDAQELTHSGKSISNARWSADGKRIVFLMGGQMWSASISEKGGKWKLSALKQVSDIPGGISEFKLSPDQKKVMYISYIKSAVKSPSDCYADLDKATAYTTDDLMYRHWDHTVMEIPHTYVSDFAFKKGGVKAGTDLLAGESELYELPTEPFGGLEQLCWSPDSRFIAYSCRKLAGKKYAFSTNTDIYIYNVKTGECARVECCANGYDTDPVWSPDGKSLAWISMERDGYEADKQTLVVAWADYSTVNKDGSGVPAIIYPDKTTSFKYNVSAPMWSDDSQDIYFASLVEGIQSIWVWHYGPNGVETYMERITGEDMWYDFGSPFYVKNNEDGSKTLLTTWCSMDFPTELVAVKYSDNGVECTPVTKENEHILSQLAEHETEARWLKTVDDKDMLTWVLYPPQFDPAKTYPAITICLGGPQGTLSQGWSYRWNYRLMASQGYVVVLPNRRGTTAFGQEWTEQISGDYPGLNMQDYLVAARTVKAEPYVDKMAACGASYGGYSVYYLCGTHGDVFDAFIAHAGIFNEEHMYMTTEEMWFPNFDNGGLHEAEFDPRVGTADCPVGPAGDGVTFGGIKQGGSPWSNDPKAVRHYALSPHKLVTNWHTPLMVIHGGMDYRVPVDEGMAAYNCAQMMGVPSRLLIFPDENHWILKPQNALLWHREYFRWLDQWCK